MDWSEREEAILFSGLKAGGEYLDELGKSDLAVLTKDECLTFLKCVMRVVVDQRLLAVHDFDDEIPF